MVRILPLLLLCMPLTLKAQGVCTGLLESRVTVRFVNETHFELFKRLAPSAFGLQQEMSLEQEFSQAIRTVKDSFFKRSPVQFFRDIDQLQHIIFEIVLNDQTVGLIGLRKNNPSARQLLNLQSPRNIRWAFMWVAVEPEFRGRGIATAAVDAVLKIAFKHLNAQGIFWEVHSENVASQKFPERGGWQFLMHVSDHDIYAIREWRK